MRGAACNVARQYGLALGAAIASHEVIWVDAFTAQPLAGNACAVLVDARGLDADMMLAIAREMNLSETAFVVPSKLADFGVHYFTPVGEIPLAGHPTIATAHALCEIGRVAPDCTTISLAMPAGVIPVAISREQGAPHYAMSQPPPVFLSRANPEAIAAALGLERSDLLAGVAPQVVSTGTPQLQVGLVSLDALDRVAVERRMLFPNPREYFSVHVFARSTGDGFALHARHFSDIGEVLEDPFTGSATGGMAAYCARYGIVREAQYRVAQGMHVRRPGSADVSVEGVPPHAIGRITVAGAAVTVLRGWLTI